MNVLIVDDDAALRRMLVAAIGGGGHNVQEAEDGAAGVALAKFQSFDLIIMDLNMPVLDGFKATRQLKNDERTKDIPILVFTSENAQANYDEIYEAGADGHILKPVDLPRLVERIKQMEAS